MGAQELLRVLPDFLVPLVRIQFLAPSLLLAVGLEVKVAPRLVLEEMVGRVAGVVGILVGQLLAVLVILPLFLQAKEAMVAQD